MRKRDTLADAARWFIDLLTAADLDQLWPEFERWVQMSAEHGFAYERIKEAWSKGDRLLPRRAPVRLPTSCDAKGVKMNVRRTH